MKMRTFAIALFIAGVLGGASYYAVNAQTGGSFVRTNMPPKVTSLPENGQLGDTVFLVNVSAGNQVGLYVCTLANCNTQLGGWVCSSCGGGGFTAGGDLTGSPSSQTVVKIQNNSVQAGVPSPNNCFLYWDPAAQYRCRILAANDIPNISAALLTSGLLDQARIPATINGDKVFTGNVSGNTFIATSGGESFLELKDNGVCTAPGTNLFHLCSQAGTIGLYPNGGSFTGIELVSHKAAANGYAGLDAGTKVPTAQLGGGTANSTTCLYGDQTYKPCTTGAGSSFTTVTFSATPTFDLSTAATFKLTLTGNVTSSTLSNVPVAPLTTQIVMIICQDATGSRTFVWPANVHGGMTVGPIASTCSAQQFATDGTIAWATDVGSVDQ